MKVVVAGGTGFIGEALVRRLIARDHEVAVLTRNPAKVRAGRAVRWSGAATEVGGADVVINLAGENIGAGRWTTERKRKIVDSRVGSTRELVEALHDTARHRPTFISASAVGYYGPRGDEVLDERAPQGEGFLADVVRQWEDSARAAEKVARVVILRFGVVLAGEGGALQKMMLPFRLGIGGPIGSGRQWMSWVDREDVLRAIEWAIDHREVHGVYNITSPNPVINRDFARALGRALHRPAVMPTPASVLRLIFGQMADEVLLSGQRVAPARASSEGFVFEYPTIDAALRHVRGR